MITEAFTYIDLVLVSVILLSAVENGRPADYLSRLIVGGPLAPLIVFQCPLKRIILTIPHMVYLLLHRKNILFRT